MMISEFRVKQSFQAIARVIEDRKLGILECYIWLEPKSRSADVQHLGFGLCGSKDPCGRFPLFHILANQTWPLTTPSRAILPMPRRLSWPLWYLWTFFPRTFCCAFISGLKRFRNKADQISVPCKSISFSKQHSVEFILFGTFKVSRNKKNLKRPFLI